VISTKPQLNLNHFTLDIPEFFIENGWVYLRISFVSVFEEKVGYLWTTNQGNNRSGHLSNRFPDNNPSGHNNRFPDNSHIHTANPNGTSHRKWVRTG
jgi:hypothetical protein